MAHITVLTQRGPAEVASEEFRTSLKSATGIWFGGGRQWHFVDAYEGTEALELLRDVLRRGESSVAVRLVPPFRVSFWFEDILTEIR